MGYLCDFCGEQRAMVYCRSDAACLCLSCDRSVHSANALSKRHSRTLLCEKCNSQPAIVRCVEENLSLCQNCDWTGHGSSTSAAVHKRQTINCYSGCPSAAELSSIWSFVLDLPAAEGEACEKELVLMSINENSAKNSWDHSTDYNGQNAPNSAKHNDSISTGWAGSSPMPKLGSLPHLQNPPSGSSDITLPKLYCPGTKDGGGFCEGDVLDDDFNLEELDFDIENYEELFRVALNQSEELFENGGIDSLFRTKDIPAADSCCQSGAAAEELSVGPVNAMQPACSTAASADSMMSTKTDSILYFNARQAHSSQPLSSHGGESSVGDWGASSMLPMGEHSWRPQCHESSTSIQSANRSNAVLRYQKKKKDRKFEKRVRYASRKARADVRRRVKGRFVKAGEAYDYDPLSQTRSY